MATSARKNKKSAEQKAREQMRYEYRLMQRQQAREQAWSAEQARRSQEFTAQQTAQQMAFQREMSDTAHQREVADLQAAGLNPVLSVSGGSGASTPQGSAGQGEQPNYVSSIVSAMPALFETMHEQAAAMKAAARSSSSSARYVAKTVDKGMDSKYSTKDAPFTGVGKEVNRQYALSVAERPTSHSETRKEVSIVKQELEHNYKFVKDFQQKLGELRMSVGASRRSGARASVSGTLKQFGSAAESLVRMANEIQGTPGRILQREARKIWNSVDKARVNKNSRTQFALLQRVEHEADYARMLLGK